MYVQFIFCLIYVSCFHLFWSWYIYASCFARRPTGHQGRPSPWAYEALPCFRTTCYKKSLWRISWRHFPQKILWWTHDRFL